MDSCKPLKSIPENKQSSFFVERLKESYQNCLLSNDSKLFLLFAKDLKGVLDAFESKHVLDQSVFSFQKLSCLYSEIDFIVTLYAKTAFAFRYHNTYVITTDDFETLQITLGDVKRWYRTMESFLSSLGEGLDTE